MTQEELDERIRLHGLFLAGESGGRRLDLSGKSLIEVDLRGRDLRRAILCGAILCGAILREADLTGADLTGADLTGADLIGADLTVADLTGANLSGAELRWANLLGAKLSTADLTEADLTGANLREATLRGANLCEADLKDCIGNMCEIKSMHIDTWPVTYTADTLQIGCERHPIARARGWRDDIEWIRRMDSKAEAWAERHLDLVLAMIDASPATTTGHEAHA